MDISEWSVHDESGVCTPAAVFIAKLRASGSMTMQNADLVVQHSTDMTMDIVDHLHNLTISKLKSC